MVDTSERTTVHGSDGTGQERRRQEIGRLQRWFRGYPYTRPLSGRAVDVVAEAGSPVSDLLASELVDGETMVFAAGFTESGSGPALVVPVEGGVTAVPDEIRLADDLYVETFDYLSSPYLAVAGPAAVRVTSVEDYQAFLEDADQAFTAGRFPGHLLVETLQLADLPALAPALARPGLARLHLSADGMVRTAVGARPTYVIGPDGACRVDGKPAKGDEPGVSEMPDPVEALTGLVGAETIGAATSRRPWLSRYVLALEALRRLGPAGVDAAVSGFHFRLSPASSDTAQEDPERPVLISTGTDVLAVTLPEFRTFRIGRDAGVLLEIMDGLGGGPQAAEVAARALSLSPSTVDELYRRLLRQLGCTPPAPRPAAEVRRVPTVAGSAR
ncbi:daptide biosynthesis RiPP recognition protein [Frankia sp. AgB32]|uniref:daptide biosynthesis RiPP recognition protein n=1 Tax=Frankia sp. AgB32 TaxID=631119 RepID=UPI0027E2F07B|nr:daptide biosynthesis RiPP recognition protein [Frankia sp. AgB32]MCK9896268.1 hypothetical protein [Frankia sp. AgB32]